MYLRYNSNGYYEPVVFGSDDEAYLVKDIIKVRENDIIIEDDLKRFISLMDIKFKINDNGKYEVDIENSKNEILNELKKVANNFCENYQMFILKKYDYDNMSDLAINLANPLSPFYKEALEVSNKINNIWNEYYSVIESEDYRDYINFIKKVEIEIFREENTI